MVESKLAFYVVLKRGKAIEDLKIRCDCKSDMELGGTLEVEEITLTEYGILRFKGEFGIIDLGLSGSDLERIIQKEVEIDEKE